MNLEELMTKHADPAPSGEHYRMLTTLGGYRDVCNLANFRKAVDYFDRAIEKAPRGREEPVVADESQVFALIRSLQ